MTSKESILILPHVKRGGGAGIYINHLASLIRQINHVTLPTHFKEDYSLTGDTITSDLNDLTDLKILFPNYKGVYLKHKVYWGLIFLLNILLFIKKRKSILHTINKHKAIVATSSIQIFLLHALAILGYKGKIVCLVQENLVLDGFSGYLVRRSIKKLNTIISISKSWSIYANKFGVKSVYIPNRFDHDESIHPNFKSQTKYQLIYLGGSEKIKGLSHLQALFDSIAAKGAHHFILLGSYTNDALIEIEKLNKKWQNTASRIETVGRVSNSLDFIKESQIVFLPIKEPHFCRPAIEAGICNKTFLISRLEGLDDFAIDGVNCLMFDPSSTEDLEKKYFLLLNDSKLREKLSNQNKSFYVDNYKNHDSLKELALIFS